MAESRRQEHDRQGRVPADRGDRERAAWRSWPTSGTRPTPSVATGCSTTGSSEACMLAGMALKRRWAARVGDRRDAPAEPGDGRERPGLLGEVLPLLGRRAADGADGRRSLPPRRRRGRRALRRGHHRRRGDPRLDLRRQLRAGRRDRRRARRAGRRRRSRRADPRRRGVRRDDRAVPGPGPGVGLPAAAGRVDQHLGPQVRPGLPRRRLGPLARRRCAARRSWSSTSTTSAATCRPSR